MMFILATTGSLAARIRSEVSAAKLGVLGHIVRGRRKGTRIESVQGTCRECEMYKRAQFCQAAQLTSASKGMSTRIGPMTGGPLTERKVKLVKTDTMRACVLMVLCPSKQTAVYDFRTILTVVDHAFTGFYAALRCFALPNTSPWSAATSSSSLTISTVALSHSTAHSVTPNSTPHQMPIAYSIYCNIVTSDLEPQWEVDGPGSIEFDCRRLSPRETIKSKK